VCAPPHHPVSSRRRGIEATWSKSSGEGATTLGARGSMLSMIASGPRGRQIPQVPQEGMHEVGGMRGSVRLHTYMLLL
jgi:hypothetical protein